MTSLIDVIFLLLLFFMLTSTFSRFSEVELTAGGVGQGAQASQVAPLFLQLGLDTLTINGIEISMEAVRDQPLLARAPDSKKPVIVSLREGVTAQRLTDLLVELRTMQGLSITILGAG